MDNIKIIIYGKGKIFQEYANTIPWDYVIAIIDRTAKKDETFRNIPILNPCKIIDFNYDYVVIYSSKFYEQIREDLRGRYYVPLEKMISWRAFLSSEFQFSNETIDILKKFISIYNIQSIFDGEISIIPKYFINKEELLNKDVLFDGIGKKVFPFYDMIYDNIYSYLNDNCKEYDLLLLWNMSDINILDRVQSKYVMIFLPYFKKRETFNKSIEEYGRVKKLSTLDGYIWIIERQRLQENLIDAKIYVVTHMDYNVKCDSLYEPICVGDIYINNAFLSEHSGDNISYLNSKINECTAMYWIWKNTKTEYVGVNHYRRYFYNNEIKNIENYLDIYQLQNIFQEYDLIVSNIIRTEIYSNLDIIQKSIDNRAFEIGKNLMRKEIIKKQPQYIHAYDEVMNGHKGIMLNMFVMKREIYNEYCEWLFSFLIGVAEEIDVDSYDNYSKRVIGFFAERMLTVWLLMHNFRIKELPVMLPV